jgi:DedD protein
LSQPAPIVESSRAPIAEPPRRYLVQMGVFNNIANAEELRAKLELAGVPSHIEARVQVGPFSSREEAESAREKIAALGLDPGILMATKK